MVANKHYPLLLILLFFLVASCHTKNGVDFYVTNKRDTLLHRVYLFPGSKPVYISNLKPGETKKVFMDFSGESKVDGSYSIHIDHSAKKQDNLFFGYYSNGIPSEKEFRISIYSDTILITPVSRNGY